MVSGGIQGGSRVEGVPAGGGSSGGSSEDQSRRQGGSGGYNTESFIVFNGPDTCLFLAARIS